MRFTNFESFRQMGNQLDYERGYLLKFGQTIPYADLIYRSPEMIRDLRLEDPTIDYSWFIGEGYYYLDESIFANGGVFYCELITY